MSGLFNFFRKVNMINKIKLSDYPINIDTHCSQEMIDKSRIISNDIFK